MRKTTDGDDNPKGGGGPGGAARESAIVERGLGIDEARFLRDLYRRGGDRDFVSCGIAPSSLVRLLAVRGWIESTQGVRGAWVARFTPAGLAKVPAALQALAAEVGAGR